MIGYVTLGTNDLAKAAVFYDAIAGELGTPRMMEYDGFIAWGKPGGGAGIGLTKPFDGNAASVGNGVMGALEAKDEAISPVAVEDCRTAVTPSPARSAFSRLWSAISRACRRRAP